MAAYPPGFIPALSDDSPEVRADAALWIIGERETELTGIEARIEQERNASRRNKLRTKHKALQNNISAWQVYMDDGCPRYAPS